MLSHLRLLVCGNPHITSLRSVYYLPQVPFVIGVLFFIIFHHYPWTCAPIIYFIEYTPTRSRLLRMCVIPFRKDMLFVWKFWCELESMERWRREVHWFQNSLQDGTHFVEAYIAGWLTLSMGTVCCYLVVSGVISSLTKQAVWLFWLLNMPICT